ncbi:MAG: hypothetical protein OXU51_10470 [Candidatus Poribacteria bacterium]|nr:hypothetical protein [Candidatus Poribacteria bacterium]
MKNEEYHNSDDAQKRYEIYLKERDELLKREVSNTENFDKAILTLSNAGLGFSLIYINSNKELTTASYKWLLWISLIAFILAVISTLYSYLSGQKSIKRQNELNERLYVKNEKAARHDKNWATRRTECLRPISVVIYILAVSFLVHFIACNALN